MKIEALTEPELEFGGGKHIDIKFGLTWYGPFDLSEATRPKGIKIGLIGTNETIEGVKSWLDKCRGEIPAKKSRQPNLFPKFPGFNAEQGFFSTLVLDSSLERTINSHEISKILKYTSPAQIVSESVALFLSEIKYLTEKANPDVLVCAVPFTLLEAMMQPVVAESGNGDEGYEFEGLDLDFHHYLKAEAMQYHKPIQIVLPQTYDKTKRLPEELERKRFRQLQDDATIAWNFHTALYYKAGGTPWRLVRDSSLPTTCYIGISFYKTLDEKSILTSTAQIFDELGEGIILRGGSAEFSKEDRQLHLSSADAQSLLSRAIENYRKEHRTYPARVVLHKSSGFNAEEIQGFREVLRSVRIDLQDFLSIRKSYTRLFRNGAYPVRRGILFGLDDNIHNLYTRGSVEFYATYPGMYVPRPLQFTCEAAENTPTFLSREILALTKMNWNNTQFDNSEPITVKAARNVGSILKYVSADCDVERRYSYYM